MNERIEQHKRYMTRGKDWPAINAESQRDEVPPCEVCGCFGNESCGHRFIDTDNFCSLVDDRLVCACCTKIIFGGEG